MKLSLTFLCYLVTLSVTAQSPRSDGGCSVAAMAKSADVIVMAIVEDAEEMPTSWTAKTAATQQVIYRPDEWLKGTLQTSPDKINTFTLDHLVVPGAPADSNQAEANPKLCAKGDRLILFLHRHKVQLPYESPILPTDRVSSHCGVLKATAKNIAKVKAALNDLEHDRQLK